MWILDLTTALHPITLGVCSDDECDCLTLNQSDLEAELEHSH